ncbi:ABC transporter permease [Pseudoflavonifractor hominis]|uniref:ABC transporter permease n=1 Tax=Pseudoflavonifractor hominis TaxID=2763059 RepID=A0ABR7HPW3_9FIRM|nr:ABC transporter permease [Pseudoflavonifractor hominis]MBC5729559.1 ABC transporter permease [Pseudoflavonifractor hominis]
MRRKDLMRMCLQNLLRRKSRTLLTVLGVFIGCCSIVIMVSLGIGMKEAQESLLAQMGDLTIITVNAPQGGKGKTKLDEALVKRLRSLGGVEAVTPKQSLEADRIRLLAGTGNRYIAEWTTVAGVDMDTLEPLGFRLTQGAAAHRSGEVMAGEYLAYNFKDTLRPEGRNMVDRWGGELDENGQLTEFPPPYLDPMKGKMTLEIEHDGGKYTFPITVAGVTKEDYAKGSETSDGLMMSLSDLRGIWDKIQRGKKKALPYTSVLVKVTGIDQVEPVEQEIKAMGYNTESMESIRKPMEQEARQKQMMLGGLGAISLFVAALGITNTMIMSISERTREIGIMKSLGCYVTDIRVMFLAEAGAIGLIGGVVGCVSSGIISLIVNLVSLGPSVENLLPALLGGEGVRRLSVIPLWLPVFGIFFSVLIGLASGYYPANKAVQIPALEAIKSE